MKRFVLTLTAMATMAFASPALAAEGAAGGDLPECAVFSQDGQSYTVVDRGRFVVTPSDRINMACHGEIPVGPPRTQVYRTACVGPDGNVISGHAVVTKSGQVHLVCHGRKSDSLPPV